MFVQRDHKVAATAATAQFLTRVVSSRFERDHIIGPDGVPMFPAVLPAQGGRAERWGWLTAGLSLPLDTFRAMMVATQVRDGSFVLGVDVVTTTGAVVPRGTTCWVQRGDTGVVVACDLPKKAVPAPSIPTETHEPEPTPAAS